MFNNTRLSRWWAFLALTATIMLALPAQANTWPLPPPVSLLVATMKVNVVDADARPLEPILNHSNVICCAP
ncbi:hypothetical protein [Salmonella enterica]|uniref:hypothetical protein n=1 Tax=Salmonella enterica TaxID=28901 RepID=UPI00398C2C69